MSTLFYPHQEPHDQSVPGSDAAEKLALLKQHAPGLVTQAFRHLEERFSLTESDLEGYDELFLRLIYHLREADQLIVSEATLFRRSVKNALLNIGVREISEKRFSSYVGRVRDQIHELSFTSVELFLQGAYVPDPVPAMYDGVTPTLREEAIRDMDRDYGWVMKDWMESKYALSDEAMERRFKCHPEHDHRYLTTNFDTARFGIVDTALRENVEKVASRSLRRLGWEGFYRSMRSRIVMALEAVRPGEKRRFDERDVYLAANGSDAFDLLCRSLVPAGSRVLVSSEEYFLQPEPEDEGVPQRKDNALDVAHFSSLEDLVRHLDSDDKPFDFILASELGRKGRIFPLSVIHEARQLLSPSTRLIVDLCQSAGRRPIDMQVCRADAVILTTQKGSNFGSGYGVLALADGCGRGEVKGLRSSVRENDLAATAFALVPSGLDTMGLAERSQATSALAGKFLQLLEAINGKLGKEVIRVLTAIDSESGLPPILELEIDGVSREHVHRIARLHGVCIAANYEDPTSDNSFRVTFHPYMGNDSLKRLAYALLDASGN